jgi:uncharacterized membrane protein YphA (DoxX/SURF4 family)
MNIGRRVYGLGAISMGLVRVAFHPPQAPLGDAIAWGGGGILILGGALLNLPRTAAAGAAVLAACFALSAVVLGGPPLIAQPLVQLSWQNFAELAALAAGGVVAYARAPAAEPDRAATIARAGRQAFGLCLPVFGASHFVYARLTASLVPAWLPPGGLFWTYATGLAQIAAGLALLSGIQARLAAALLTLMYALFALLVHTPLILAAPHTGDNWAELCETLALAGVAWATADSAGRKPVANSGQSSHNH